MGGEGDAADFEGTNGGTLQGGATFGPGEVGQAFVFNGANQFVQISNSASLNPTGSFSIEAWIYDLQLCTVYQAIVSKDSAHVNETSYDFLVGQSNRLEFYISDAAHQADYAFQDLVTAPNLIPTNTWTHVAAVYDQSTGTRHIYVNGVEVTNRTQTPFTVFNSASPVGIGAIVETNNTASYFFPGLIDEVSFYNQALSAAQVQAIYNASSSGKCFVPPAITVQPANQAVAIGNSALFTVGATGSGPLTY